MLKKAAGKLLSAVLLATVPSMIAAEDKVVEGSAPSILQPGQVVVKTEADIEAGKRNVVSVAEQLRTLFAPTRKVKRQVTEPAPYLQVIPTINGRATLIYKCRYNTASKISAAIDSLITDDGLVEPTVEQNMLIISDIQANIDALAKTIPAIDVASPQVLIEAKVIEVLISDGMQRNVSLTFSDRVTTNGVDMLGNKIRSSTMNTGGFSTQNLDPSKNKGGGSFDWTFAAGDGNVHASVQWLLNAQDARVLSAPTIVVARNEKSVISNGQDIPIQSMTNTGSSIQTSTTFKRVGVTLTVEPKMINQDSVTLKVAPQVSNIQSYQTITQGSGSYEVPVISIRNIETNLKLEDGQVVVMGGLYNNREAVRQERIPFLSDIPYVGEFFTSKYREKELIQLLFFLRVRILTPEDLADGILFDPDQVASDSNAIGEIIRHSPSLPKTQNTLNQVKQEFIDKDMLNQQSVPVKSASEVTAKD